MAYPIKTTTLQNAATATGAGTAIAANKHIGHRFRLRCSGGTATVIIESSIDGTDFDELETLSMTAGANEIREVSGPHYFLRARISAISAATVTVIAEQYYSDPSGAAL